MDKTNSYRVDDDVDTMRVVSILGTFGNMDYHFYCIAVGFMDKPVLEKNMDKLRNRVGYIFDHYRVCISFSPDICPLPGQTFKRRDNNHYYMLFIHPDERTFMYPVETEASGNIANKVNNQYQSRKCHAENTRLQTEFHLPDAEFHLLRVRFYLSEVSFYLPDVLFHLSDAEYDLSDAEFHLPRSEFHFTDA